MIVEASILFYRPWCDGVLAAMHVVPALQLCFSTKIVLNFTKQDSMEYTMA